MTARLRVGMGDSYGVRVTVSAGPDFDPTAVTGATLMITKPTTLGGTANVQWTASLASQSAASVQAVYVFRTDGSDLDCAGTWLVWVQWTQPGKTPGPRSEVISFAVATANKV